MDKDFLLKTYGQCYNAEAGPWNLSLQNKYLEYMFTRFYEENFQIPQKAEVCNIGIGAGYWDRYLSYHLNGGTLTSIDILESCCRQLEACLANERNPNPVRIICSDMMLLNDLEGRFDIVTMVGSARTESGLREDILARVASFLKPGGSLYYQTLDKEETKEWVSDFCEHTPVKAEAYLLDTAYGFKAQYWKLTKYEN
ncbi:MAG: class I SAM-dependent methyltransferase [Oscillospiraceae bacterium]|nr:class I SAM-dependent methyltransferase [Oscillospiraceae bacterium]